MLNMSKNLKIIKNKKSYKDKKNFYTENIEEKKLQRNKI